MELCVALCVPKRELPGDYRPVFVSLFKALLLRFYPVSYEQLYGGDSRPKDFTFAVRFQNPVFVPDRVLLSDEKVLLSFSSDDDCCALLFYNLFQKGRGYCHPLPNGGTMQLTGVHLQAQPRLHCRAATIKFLSPLVVRRHEPGLGDRYFVSEDAEFPQALQYVVSRQLGRETALRLEPVAPRKTVVRSFGVKLRCSLGTYRIEGAPEVLDILSRSGLGSRRGEGYGYFKLVGG